MRLLIDMGNQRLKWLTVVEGAKTHGIESVPSRRGAGEIDELLSPGAARRKVSEPWNLPVPDAVWVSAVSPDQTRADLAIITHDLWGLDPQFVASPEGLGGLANGYDIPAQLGVDRWLAGLAAYCLLNEKRIEGSGVAIVDAGTAVTVDLVLDHQFLGGSILPGLSLASRVLGSDTARIAWSAALAQSDDRNDDQSVVHTDENNPAPPTVASNTRDAVASGAIAAVCGGVRFAVEALDNLHSGGPLPVVVTGGDARLVSRYLDPENTRTIIEEPDLVLRGLRHTARLTESEPTS